MIHSGWAGAIPRRGRPALTSNFCTITLRRIHIEALGLINEAFFGRTFTTPGLSFCIPKAYLCQPVRGGTGDGSGPCTRAARVSNERGAVWIYRAAPFSFEGEGSCHYYDRCHRLDHICRGDLR